MPHIPCYDAAMKPAPLPDDFAPASAGGLRVLVCGGRGFGDYEALAAILDAFRADHPIAVLIHGAAEGADRTAGDWAAARAVAMDVYPADWDTHGRAAGPLRNEQMLAEGKPDLVVAFPGAHGTATMIRLARRADVPVWKPMPFDEAPPKAWEKRQNLR